jgi:hypothetical protein
MLNVVLDATRIPRFSTTLRALSELVRRRVTWKSRQLGKKTIGREFRRSYGEGAQGECE